MTLNVTAAMRSTPSQWLFLSSYLFPHAEEFETPLYQSTMLNAPHYDPKAVWEGFWWTAATLNKRMVVHNAAILAPHHWQSKWYEWIMVSERACVRACLTALFRLRHAHRYSQHAVWVVVALSICVPRFC